MAQPLGERNPKWLNDDYVKFIRFAQWRIEQTGHGVLAFVTNHGYLDNPTFRGMRQSLMRTFDDIYVLDLHGNSKKKERTPGRRQGRERLRHPAGRGHRPLRAAARRGHRRPLTRASTTPTSGASARASTTGWPSRTSPATEWTEVTPTCAVSISLPHAMRPRYQEEYEAGWSLPMIAPSMAIRSGHCHNAR